jgi:hypothetical protein
VLQRLVISLQRPERTFAKRICADAGSSRHTLATAELNEDCGE